MARRATGAAVVTGAASVTGTATVAGPAAASRVQAALIRLLPFATVAIAAFVPLAAGLYLATSTAWTLAERAALGRWALRPAIDHPGRAAPRSRPDAGLGRAGLRSPPQTTD